MTYTAYSLNYPANAVGAHFGDTAGRTNPHRGLDVAPDGGGPVYALADGRLVYDWYSAGLGNVAVLAHADGKFSGYAHLAAESPLTIGTKVKRGQSIGTIGNTGSLSRGRHLHLTVATSMAGAAGGYDVIDPFAWIQAHPPLTSAAIKPAILARKPLTRIYTATAQDGEPGAIYWTKVQRELRARKWYAGRVDGKPGAATHHGHRRLQAAILNSNGRPRTWPRTSTEIDGKPGRHFWRLAQRAGKRYGYTGRQDGKPGPLTERALFRLTAAWLNKFGR